jgi:hypothetical protein
MTGALPGFRPRVRPRPFVNKNVPARSPSGLPARLIAICWLLLWRALPPAMGVWPRLLRAGPEIVWVSPPAAGEGGRW